MPQTFGPVYLKPGVAFRLYFSLEAPLATNSDRFVTGTVAGLPIVAGDIRISIDAAASAAVVGVPVQIDAAQSFYYVDLTAAETQGEVMRVIFKDQTAAPVFRDFAVELRSILRVGQLNRDPTAFTAANVDGDYIAGKGTGLAINLVPGTARHTNLFDTVMGAEPTAIGAAVGATRSVGQFIQDVWYRFYRKHKKTGSGSSGQVIVYKEDGLAAISTQTASKTGTDQTIEKAS